MPSWKKYRTINAPAGVVVADADWKVAHDAPAASLLVRNPQVNAVVPCNGMRLLALPFGGAGMVALTGTVTAEILEQVATDNGSKFLVFNAAFVMTIGDPTSNPALPPGVYVFRVTAGAGINAAADRVELYSKEV